jgi:ribulose-5-phosphate 4-epimerase/fuculose-1-phosphate aldolase
VTVGQNLLEAFVLANDMVENARRQVMALQIGQPYAFIDDELALCREKLWSQALFQRAWDHFRAKLDRD